MIKLIEINSETHICEHCGKSNLKRVAVLDIDGTIVRYGRDCAAKALGTTVGKNIDLLVEITAYVNKYPNAENNNMVRAIWNKYGMTAKYTEGRYHIHGLGQV